jgi:hypothetical protein
LATEYAAWSFGGEHLLVLVVAGTFGADGDDVALDIEVDRVGGDTGNVEFDDEGIALAPRVRRHDRRPGHDALSAEDLLGEPVQFAVRVGAHQHRVHLHASLLDSGPHRVHAEICAALLLANGRRIDFNDDDPAEYSDFAYLYFSISITFRVSDTMIQTKPIHHTATATRMDVLPVGAVIIAASINLVSGLAK